MNVPSLVAGIVFGGSVGTLLVWLQQTAARKRLTNQLTAQLDQALLGRIHREKAADPGPFAVSASPEHDPGAGATATIQSDGVCPSDRGDNLSYVGYVIFSYRVADKDYSSFCARSFLTRDDAERFIELCRCRSLTARYRPERPQESCLVVDLGGTRETSEAENLAEAVHVAPADAQS